MPDTLNETYGYPEAIYRDFALRALKDYVRDMPEVTFDMPKIVGNLDKLLSKHENFKDIMIPHER